MSSWGVGGLVPKEEIERAEQRIKQWKKDNPFPSCETCKHKLVTILKYRKYRGEYMIKESTEKYELNLNFKTGDFATRRPKKCEGYEYGQNHYVFESKKAQRRFDKAQEKAEKPKEG